MPAGCIETDPQLRDASVVVRDAEDPLINNNLANRPARRWARPVDGLTIALCQDKAIITYEMDKDPV